VPGLVFGGEIISINATKACNTLKLWKIILCVILNKNPLKAKTKPKKKGCGVGWLGAILSARSLLHNAISVFALCEQKSMHFAISR